MSRPDWDQYFMKIAEDVATRSTCDRLSVGAVIVKDKRILTTGYNGSPRGLPHCDDVGHELKEMEGKPSCIRTVHGEANAVINAARDGVAINGATVYMTYSPCVDCAKMLINAGIVRVIYGEAYASRHGQAGSDMTQKLFAQAHVGYRCIKDLEASDVECPVCDLGEADGKHRAASMGCKYHHKR